MPCAAPVTTATLSSNLMPAFRRRFEVASHPSHLMPAPRSAWSRGTPRSRRRPSRGRCRTACSRRTARPALNQTPPLTASVPVRIRSATARARSGDAAVDRAGEPVRRVVGDPDRVVVAVVRDAPRAPARRSPPARRATSLSSPAITVGSIQKPPSLLSATPPAGGERAALLDAPGRGSAAIRSRCDRRDDRAADGARVGRVAGRRCERHRVGGDLHRLVVPLARHQQPGRQRAALAGVHATPRTPPCRPRPPRSASSSTIAADLPPSSRKTFFSVGAAAGHDRAAGRGGAGERDQVDPRVGGEQRRRRRCRAA